MKYVLLLSLLLFPFNDVQAESANNKSWFNMMSEAHAAMASIERGNISLIFPSSTNQYVVSTDKVSATKLLIPLTSMATTNALGLETSWRISATATPFSNEGTVLPRGMIELQHPNRVISNETDSPQPTLHTAPWILDTENHASIMTSKHGDGMGIYEFEFQDKGFIISTLRDVESGIYTSNLNWSIIAGP